MRKKSFEDHMRLHSLVGKFDRGSEYVMQHLLTVHGV